MSLRTPDADTFVCPDDLPNNTSPNAHFEQVLGSGLSRRGLLRGGLGGAMATMFAPLAASWISSGSRSSPSTMLGRPMRLIRTRRRPIS